MPLRTGGRRAKSVGFMLLALLMLAVSGCEDPELGMTSSGGTYEKTFSNEDVRMSFRMIGVWLRMEIENLTDLAISWHWPKDSFTVPDGRTYTVAFINEFNRIAKKYEAGPLDGFVPTIKSVIRVSNRTQVIPAGCTSYNFVVLVNKPKEYEYFFEHAYEDKEAMEKRKKELSAAYPRPTALDKMVPEELVSDVYLDVLPRIKGLKAAGEYVWKAKYYVGTELRRMDIVFDLSAK